MLYVHRGQNPSYGNSCKGSSPHGTAICSVQPLLSIWNNIYEFQSILTLNIVIYIQQDATLHSLLYLETALHILGGTTTHHQERIQLYLQHLVFVTPLLLSATIMEELELV